MTMNGSINYMDFQSFPSKAALTLSVEVLEKVTVFSHLHSSTKASRGVVKLRISLILDKKRKMPEGSQIVLVSSIVNLLVVLNPPETKGHGRLIEPPNRSSIWRFPEFSELEPPINYNDNELFCGNFTTQYELNDGKCGICGDPYDQAQPRDNEEGGKFYAGIIVRGYFSGMNMPVEVELTASHLGYFELRLCAEDDIESHSDQNCYNQHLLELADGSGTRFNVSSEEPGPFYASYDVILPLGVTCNHCVVQWQYTTGNRWGLCELGLYNATGCGPQETFRGCSDIIIYPTRLKLL